MKQQLSQLLEPPWTQQSIKWVFKRQTMACLYSWHICHQWRVFQFLPDGGRTVHLGSWIFPCGVSVWTDIFINQLIPSAEFLYICMPGNRIEAIESGMKTTIGIMNDSYKNRFFVIFFFLQRVRES